ncbi:MAG: VWA domain-containing protein [Desulfobacterales bacterium]|nr:VWA domain-containing protein [Desulfobacterales bacterium]
MESTLTKTEINTISKRWQFPKLEWPFGQKAATIHVIEARNLGRQDDPEIKAKLDQAAEEIDAEGTTSSIPARCAIGMIALLLLQAVFPAVMPPVYAFGTAQGIIEQRAAPVARRKCVGGENAGQFCNEDTDCRGSSCFDRNVFNLSVAVHYDAPAADITAIENLITAGSGILFDVTDGQAEIGEAFIHNNAFGTTDADVRIYPATCISGTSVGLACANNNACPPNPPNSPPGECGIWWQANSGDWQSSGSIHVSMNNMTAETAPGESFAHEFTHLVFDARDEYHARPGCAALPDENNPPADECPHATTVAAGETPTLMDAGGTGAADGLFSEYCWGQADSADPTDVSAGNHDADNTTEQSQCRSNRSVWDQVVWSWPNAFAIPGGAPDAGAYGAAINPPRFVLTEDNRRVVLVLDESWSMTKESPSRMERLKVAARDFVTLAETGTEIGIVSYSDDASTASGRVNLAVSPLPSVMADRSPWTDAIDDLTPDSRTNIGAGLQRARELITSAGGVTANTYVVLMTDGLNNEPTPQATADATLQAQIDALLNDGIPVYVTCTGSDLGLDSQCAEIGAGTGGFYVDSADASKLPEAFVDFQARIAAHEPIASHQGQLSEAKEQVVFVEQGSSSVAFVLIWDNPVATAGMTVIDPDGNKYDSLPMAQGRYYLHPKPVAGDWKAVIHTGGDVFVDSGYLLRAYSRNQSMSLAAGVPKAVVKPGEGIRIHAFPRSIVGAVSHPTASIKAVVTRPDGSIDTLELHDRGRDSTGQGDDVPQDGTFTGIYRNTQIKGAYTFLIEADMDGWAQAPDSLTDFRAKGEAVTPVPSPRFVREYRVSAVVADPRDVEITPEDGPGAPPAWWDDFCNLLALLLLLGLILALLVLWYCCLRPKPVRKLANLAPLPDPRPGIGFCRLVASGPHKGRLKVAVVNYGEADAPASTTTVTFSTGDAVDLATPPIRAGESVELEPVEFPKGCFDPDCHFRIVVDSRNEVTESDKSNNVAEYFCLG